MSELLKITFKILPCMCACATLARLLISWNFSFLKGRMGALQVSMDDARAIHSQPTVQCRNTDNAQQQRTSTILNGCSFSLRISPFRSIYLFSISLRNHSDNGHRVDAPRTFLTFPDASSALSFLLRVQKSGEETCVILYGISCYCCC